MLGELFMRYLVVFCAVLVGALVQAEAPVVFQDGPPQDHRLGELKTLNGFFPLKPVTDLDDWIQRQAEIKRRILVSQGLWPLPTRTPLNAVIHGRVERDDYVVDRVFFESIPGNYVTGSLYRPKKGSGPFPVVLSPHGHWQDGRFYDAGLETVSKQIETGAEQFKQGGRFPLQARAVQLARMGCMVFHYDMIGYADANQLGHRPEKWKHLDRAQGWGFMSVQADLRLQNMMGLQTWNSIRAVDFVLQLDDVDPSRVGVTGASGGGTQSMILGAIDERIAASMPCVMVSTAMQGGCTCENAPLLRIDQGNIDIAAATAPRPLGLTAADDWTIDLKTRGFPDLENIYQMMGVASRLSAVFHTRFPHNYNQVNRAAMYAFFNRHFALGYESITERDFQPLSQSESTVWNHVHPKPSGDQVGDLHETRMLALVAQDSDRKVSALVPESSEELLSYQDAIGGAWETLIGRRGDQVGKVVYKETSAIETPQLVIQAGAIRNLDHEEEFPVLKFALQKTPEKQISIVWVMNDGKAAAFENGRVVDEILLLVKAGYTVIVPDLFGQGELAENVIKDQSQRMWFQRDGDKGWHRFSGYTYGFNHCLFAQRTHDLLSVIMQADSLGEVCIIGRGKVAGPLVAAAYSQARMRVKRCIIEPQGFNFAAIQRHDDPMFVPGAVKYLGLDGLISLVAPGSLVISGDEYPITRKIYAANKATGRLKITDHGIEGKALLAELQFED
jgi:dienelactone hydrolase